MDRFASNLFARLKKAMSYSQALETLGFGPNDHPSAPEIAKAYKMKAVENHPDRGGSNEKMVEINVAKDILDGKQRPTYERGPSSYDSTPSNWSPPPPAKKVEVSFEEAKSKAGVPSNVEWLFITDTQRNSNNYNGDESSRSVRAWVLYGRTVDKHVFVGIENAQYSGLAGANDAGYDKWAIRSNEYPLSEKASPSWIYAQVAKMLGNLNQFSGRFNSKVVDIKGKLTSLTEREVMQASRSGKTTSIKNLLVNTGEVGEDDPSVQNRKIPVELEVQTDMAYGGTPKPGYYPAPASQANTWDGKYHGDYYKITLTMAGREFVLNEEDTQKLLGLKLGGRKFLQAVFGDYIYEGKKKLITRMPKGKVILEGFLRFLKHLPGPAVELLQRAHDQMK